MIREDKVNRLRKTIALEIVLVILLTSTILSCGGKARHIATNVTLTLVTAVNAVDDAEFKAWELAQRTPGCAFPSCWDQSHHDAANPKIKQALLDARAVVTVVQISSGVEGLPRTLPSLIRSLVDVRTILGLLPSTGPLSDLAAKAQMAVDKALEILDQFAEGSK